MSVVAAAPASSLSERYAAAFPGSRKRFEKARVIFPAGVTHDTRMMSPFPVYIDRAKGSKKWDVDGHELIDYFVGHGSMLLGHSPDDIVKVVQEQMAKGTHHGACHDLEIAWGELVLKLIPSAERVRFTGSGTEATLMALRLSRLYTGKPKVLKFLGHFHGWHDFVSAGSDPPYDTMTVPGIPEDITSLSVTIPPNDLNLVEATLAKDAGIGAVILEPTGGHWGSVPIRGEFLKGLREITARLGRVLIFDEVITGFRVSPGGAQAFYGVTPDLTTMAKILAGGLPGGALAGKAEILAFIEPRPGKPKMKHPGTYNANPLSAAAGVAALTRVGNSDACKKANDSARELRNKLNAMFAANKFPWIAYGDFSMVKTLPGYTGERPRPETNENSGFVPFNNDVNALDGPKDAKLTNAVRQGMLLHGVDWWGMNGMTSCEHSTADVDRTVKALESTLGLLRAEGMG